MRHFMRQSIKVGRVCSFNQSYKSKDCDDILKIISEEFTIKGNFYDTIEAYLDYENKYLKNFEKENEKKLKYYRKENVEEKDKIYQ